MKTPHDDFYEEEWEEDFYPDDWDEEEADPFSCDNCGPWCPEWGGDGLCMVAIRAMAEEYEREQASKVARLKSRLEERSKNDRSY